MSSLFNVLGIGRSALQVQQTGISVTGHNIANVNTPGYSRQRVDLTSGEPVAATPGQMGGGVQAVSVQRMHDRFLGAQIDGQSQELGKWEAEKSGLERLQIIFDETGETGLNHNLQEFWHAWQDLANNPGGSVERSQLVSKSQALSDRFQQMSAAVTDVQSDLDTQIDQAVSDINDKAGQVAALNHRIRQAENMGQAPNDLKDRRDQLVKELSSLANVSASESGPVVNISIDGHALVDDETAYALSYTNPDFSIQTSGGSAVIAASAITSGKVGGYLAAKTDGQDYLARLNDLAAGIIDNVNTLHAGGQGLDHSTGLDFFAAGATSAANIAVNPVIVSDPSKIAAAGAAEDVPGGAANAMAIGNLEFQDLMNGNTATFGAYYASLVGDVAGSAKTAADQFDQNTSVMNQLESYRDEVSGVSIDEEMVNLVQFQHAYAAAAKLISATDEMLDVLMNMG